MPVRAREDTIEVELKDIWCEDVDSVARYCKYMYEPSISINDEVRYCLNEC
jgi:hypothetical protein